MELRQLRYFVTVAEEGHFGRAATKLHRSQPPVSMQVKQLEDELGVTLFKRTTRQVELTEEGKIFLSKARAVLNAANEARNSVGKAALELRGTLHVGFVSSAALSFLPTALRRFHDAYPEVVITLRELTSAEQRKAFLENRIRVGIVRLPLEAPRLSIIKAYYEKLIVALPADHELTALRTIPVQKLAGVPMISFPRHLTPGATSHLMQIFASAGLEPNITQEAIHHQTIESLISSGLGLSILPSSSHCAPYTGVVYRPLDLPAEQVTTWLGIAHLQGDDTPLVKNFTTILKETARQLQQTQEHQRRSKGL